MDAHDLCIYFTVLYMLVLHIRALCTLLLNIVRRALQYSRLVIGTVHVWITVVLFLPYQLQPNRVPVNLWVKEKKKWSKKTQPAAVLSKKFTLYKAAKVSLCLGDVQYMDGYGCRCVFGVVCGVNKQVLLKVPCVHTAHVLCSCVYSDVLLCTLYTSTLYPTTVCTYICVYVCTYICVCVCTYICVHKVWTFTILPSSHGVCLPCLPHPSLQVYQEVFKVAVDEFDLYIGFAPDIKCPAPTRYQFWLKGRTDDMSKCVPKRIHCLHMTFFAWANQHHEWTQHLPRVIERQPPLVCYTTSGVCDT